MLRGIAAAAALLVCALPQVAAAQRKSMSITPIGWSEDGALIARVSDPPRYLNTTPREGETEYTLWCAPSAYALDTIKQQMEEYCSQCDPAMPGSCQLPKVGKPPQPATSFKGITVKDSRTNCRDRWCDRKISLGKAVIHYREPTADFKAGLRVFFRPDGKAAALLFSDKDEKDWDRFETVLVVDLPGSADAQRRAKPRRARPIPAAHPDRTAPAR